MQAQHHPGKPLTGRKVLAITVSAFSVIIAVNVYMAYQAVSTFPGLEVDNSYVASQTFDAERAAQAALGWHLSHAYRDGRIVIDIRDAAGAPAKVASLNVLVGRKTEAREDSQPAFTFDGQVWSAPVTLAPGAWLMHLEATAADGTAFRQRLDMMVKG